MFVLRGIAVSLTFLVLLYCLLSAALVFALPALNRPQMSSRRRADLLFWVRITPLLASASITLALVVPAYVRLEPRAIDEDMGLPVVLAIGCLLLFTLGVFRVVNAVTKSARVVSGWLTGADLLDTGTLAPAFQAIH